jgi:hypothetical protein
MNPHDDYETLRQQADAARDQLMSTLEHLDRRRHDLTDVRLQLKRHPVAAASIATGLVVIVGALGWLGYRLARREQHTWRERARALRRAWHRPQRVASGKQGPFATELGRRVLLGLFGFTAIELGKLGVRRLLPERR